MSMEDKNAGGGLVQEERDRARFEIIIREVREREDR